MTRKPRENMSTRVNAAQKTSSMMVGKQPMYFKEMSLIGGYHEQLRVICLTND